MRTRDGVAAPLQGAVDQGARLTQQSLLTPDGSRVSLGWIPLPPGFNSSGVQGLARAAPIWRLGLRGARS